MRRPYLLGLEHVCVDPVHVLGHRVAEGPVAFVVGGDQLVQALAGVPGNQVEQRAAQLVQFVHQGLPFLGLLQQGLERGERVR